MGVHEEQIQEDENWWNKYLARLEPNRVAVKIQEGMGSYLRRNIRAKA